MALHYSRLQQYHVAMVYYRAALAAPVPPRPPLFDAWQVRRWYLPLEAAVALYYEGSALKALDLNTRLLADTELPPHLRGIVVKNQAHCHKRLAT
jgi:hypothetical protein